MNADDLRQRQHELMAYLLGRNEHIAAHVANQGNIDIVTRLSIYRHAYRKRLRETMDTDHPITGTYLGDTLFENMVDGFIDSYPSSYRSLRQFCDRLPRFLSEQTPFSDNPQIAELAQFERCLLTAFDAADAPRESLELLSQLPADSWPEMTITFHPSVAVFTCRWNVVEIWQAIKADCAPPAAVQQPLSWLLWRNAERLTEFRALDVAEQTMIQTCLSGANFATVCEALLDVLPEDNISAVAVNRLSQWLSEGLVRKSPPLSTARS